MESGRATVVFLVFVVFLFSSFGTAFSQESSSKSWLNYEQGEIDGLFFAPAEDDFLKIADKGETGKKCVDELDGSYSAASCVGKKVGEACNDENTRFCSDRKCEGYKCVCGCSRN